MKLPIVSVCMVWVKGSEVMCVIGPRSYKATKAKGFRGKMWENVKEVSRNNVRKVRNNSGGRWGCILSLGCRISI